MLLSSAVTKTHSLDGVIVTGKYFSPWKKKTFKAIFWSYPAFVSGQTNE